MGQGRLNLKDALKAGKLADFVAQEEKRHPEGGDAKAFDKTMKAAVIPPQSKRRT